MLDGVRSAFARAGYTLGKSVTINIVSGLVCAGGVAILMGYSPVLVVTVIAGVVFLIA